MNNPLLSIITINFNNAEGLRKTLESVRIQDDISYEHIIIDGGSSDSSVQVIEEYLKDPVYSKHVTFWCSEKDKGIYNAMNKGIGHACGKYVYMLNSGDQLVPHILSFAFPYLEKNNDSVIYGAIDCYNGATYEGTLCHKDSDLKTMMIPHQGSFVPLKIHNEYGLYDENFKIVADREFMVRIKKASVQFTHIPLIICIYDVSGISSQNSKLKDKENLIISNSFISGEKIVTNKIIHIIRLLIEYILPGFISIPLIRFISKKRHK